LISNERVRAWLESAEADADRRGLPDLKPVLRLFAQATAALRAADWNGLTLPDDEEF
jgi:hypothetical protein